MRLLVSLGLATSTFLAAPPPTARADSFTVDIQSDQNNGCTLGACSLREAILAANSASGPDTILLPAGTYTLTLSGVDDIGAVGDLDITDSVTLLGADAATTIINANGLDRVFDIVSGSVTFVGVTIRNGVANNGGGLYLHAGSVVTLTDATLTTNTTTNNGGGIYNNGGALILDHAQILSNTAPNAGSGNGGGLYSLNGTVVITNATLFQDNAANANSAINAGLGGAIHAEGGTLTLVNATLTHNLANDGGGLSLGTGANATLTHALIISNTTADDGAGIENDDGAVMLVDSQVLSNTASLTDTNGEGGGLNNGNGLGTLFVINSTISGNSARNGGGISNDGGHVTLVNSTVSNNTAPTGSGRGGGINNYDASIPVTLTITNSAIYSNTSGIDGGGIRHGGAAGTLAMDNSTLSGNISVSGSGGGLYNTAQSTLANVTLAFNTAANGDGLRNTGTLIIRNSLLAHNDTQNCNNSGTLTSQGYNLKSDATCGSVFNAAGDMTNTLAALIGPLQNNGGPTFSHAPLNASPGAIDAGHPSGCLSTAGLVLADDQRGFARPVSGRCDIGAVEYTHTDLGVSLSDDQTNAVPGLPLTYTMVVTNSGAVTVTGATITNTTSDIFVNSIWACTASAGSTCPASGTGALSATLTLAPASILSFTITGSVASHASGALTHTAYLVAPVGVNDSAPANNTAIDSDNLTPQSDVGLSNTDGQAAALPGSPLTYTIVVTNAGPSDAVGVLVTDVFPSALESVTWSCTASGGSLCPASGGGSIGAVVDLAAGGTATFLATGMITASATGALTNTATLSDDSDQTPENNTATDTTLLTAAVDLGLALTDDVTTATPGTALTYTLVVSNAGPSPATDALITSSFPTAFENVFWECIAASGSTCGALNGTHDISVTVFLLANGVVTFTANGLITASATGALTTTAAVSPSPADDELGPLPNTATDVDMLAPLADVQITVSDGQMATTAGSLITYTLIVTNSGPSAVSGVVVTDVFPSAVENILWSCVGSSGGICPASGAGHIVTNTVNLPPNARVTFVAAGQVALTATGPLTNTAWAAAPSEVLDPNPSNNISTDTTALTPGTIVYQLYLPVLQR